jgi:arginine metabolism regulation protein II
MIFKCRIRHVKCDETRPTCAMCRHFNQACGGYERRILFGPNDTGANSKFRRLLFTEHERQSMSEGLVASVPPKTAYKLLLQIDDECAEATNQLCPNIDIHRGPFRAFRLDQSSSRPKLTTNSLIEEVDYDDSASGLPGLKVSSWSDELFDSFLTNPEPVAQPEFLDLGNSPLDASLLHELVGGSLQPYHHEIQTNTFGEETTRLLEQPLSLSASVPSPTYFLGTLPQDAPFLLSNYKDFVICLLSPVKRQKTPWHTLFLPISMYTLAEMTLNQDSGNARLSIFYATLCISALSLRSSPQNLESWKHWNERGNHYMTKARENLKLTLWDAFSHPKKVKYKEILMALLSMMQALVSLTTSHFPESGRIMSPPVLTDANTFLLRFLLEMQSKPSATC